MLVIIQMNHRELTIVLGDKYLRVCLCFQQILEYLQFYEAASEVGCSKFKYKSDTKSARIQLVKLLIFNTLYCQIVL